PPGSKMDGFYCYRRHLPLRPAKEEDGVYSNRNRPSCSPEDRHPACPMKKSSPTLDKYPSLFRKATSCLTAREATDSQDARPTNEKAPLSIRERGFVVVVLTSSWTCPRRPWPDNGSSRSHGTSPAHRHRHPWPSSGTCLP